MQRSAFYTKTTQTFCIICLVFFIGACSVYKPELQQGNLLTAEQISKLQVGMPKAQVQLLLGSPLLQDVFHANRWEYIFRQVKGDKTLEQRVFTIEFDASGKVTQWTGIGKGDNAKIELSRVLKIASSKPALPLPSPAVKPADDSTSALKLTSGVGSMGVSNRELAALPALVSAPKITQENEIKLVLESWRSHWEKANFASYIAHYSPTFIGTSRNRVEWEKDRKRMIAGRKIESITINQVVVQKTAELAARAYFKQYFQATDFKQSGEKTLMLERINGQWLIVSETFNKA